MPDYVSSLKQTTTNDNINTDQSFGVERGSFKWNSVTDDQHKHKDSVGSGKKGKNPVVAEVSVPAPAEAERDFELLDISILFPVGKLTYVYSSRSNSASLNPNLSSALSLVRRRLEKPPS